MECEICGKVATKKALVEETLLNVCSACLRFGKEVQEEIKPQKSVYPLQELSLDPSFATIIKSKREAMQLSREQLAGLIKEKSSVIERIEHGMRPTKDVAKKLEHALRVKLLGYEIKEEKLQKTKHADVTLGDIASVRVRKKK